MARAVISAPIFGLITIADSLARLPVYDIGGFLLRLVYLGRPLGSHLDTVKDN